MKKSSLAPWAAPRPESPVRQAFMRLGALVLGLLIWGGLGGAPALAQQPPASVAPAGESFGPLPRIFVERFEYDAGEVEPATMVSHQFTFKNEGQAPLVIDRVLVGCGCLAAKFDREVAPGATGQVTASIRVYRDWAGQDISKAFWLFTNDPLNPQVRLIMTARVKEFPSKEDPSS